MAPCISPHAAMSLDSKVSISGSFPSTGDRRSRMERASDIIPSDRSISVIPTWSSNVENSLSRNERMQSIISSLSPDRLYTSIRSLMVPGKVRSAEDRMASAPATSPYSRCADAASIHGDACGCKEELGIPGTVVFR